MGTDPARQEHHFALRLQGDDTLGGANATGSANAVFLLDTSLSEHTERFGIEQVFEGLGATEANYGLTNVDNVVGAVGRITHPEYTNVRIQRWDVSLAFLSTWAALLAGRVLWLDYSAGVGSAMWLQQISNGATLLFAFFMISDPMTTPQRRSARVAYAMAVAIVAFLWQFVLYKPHGLIVVLFAASALVPLINTLWPTVRFEWRQGEQTPAKR